MIKKVCFFLLMLPVLVNAQKFTIVNTSKNSAVVFSVSELKKFLNSATGFTYVAQQASANWVINLKKDAKLPESSFAVKSYQRNNKQYVELIGTSDQDISAAVYTFLEKMGYTFEFGSYALNGKLNKAAVKQYSQTIVPLVKYRGIRQHINFPMDVSSYSLPDAKFYIRSLVRMRFNFIAFHSYPGQWYEIKKKDTTEYAGNFFYGDRHDISNNELIKQHVHNKKTFCIPEIEPYFENIPKRSQLAVKWLSEVINEAKRVGMTVQYSLEPRNPSTDVQSTLNAVQQVYKQFPQIDILEMITEESGGWGPSNTADETKNILTSFFGKEILTDTIITSPIRPVQSDLGYIYGQIGHIIKTINLAKQQHIKLPPVKLGVYCTNQYNVPTYHLARKFFPADKISIMPAHGSENVANAAPKVLENANNWANTTIYSWLEFDGMMYLQQNGIQGIYKLLDERPDKSPNARLNTMAFNHWRTAENKITARYASLATLYGPENPAQFYTEYANKLGIALPGTFSNAMLLLQKAFSSHSSNIGFAWMGYWRNGFNFADNNTLNGLIEKYQIARAEIDKCAIGNKNPYAKETIEFLDNRLRATIIYLQAFVKANELNAPGISNEQYNTICNDVLGIFNTCMKVYAEMMPDRGCEGTLINLYLSPVRAIKISRQKKTGVPLDEPLKPGSHFDAPAPPIFQGGN